MVAKTFIKDPDSSLDWTIDWTNWLGSGRTVASSDWTVPSGLTEVSASIDSAGLMTTIVLSGGTAGTTYEVTNTVTLDNGYIAERTLRFQLEER